MLDVTGLCYIPLLVFSACTFAITSQIDSGVSSGSDTFEPCHGGRPFLGSGGKVAVRLQEHDASVPEDALDRGGCAKQNAARSC